MKHNNYIGNSLVRGTLLMTVASLAILGNSALAQEKGAERLMKLARPAAPPTVQSTTQSQTGMSCHNSRDAGLRTPDWSAKGAQALQTGGRPTKAVAIHPCDGCATK